MVRKGHTVCSLGSYLHFSLQLWLNSWISISCSKPPNQLFHSSELTVEPRNPFQSCLIYPVARLPQMYCHCPSITVKLRFPVLLHGKHWIILLRNIISKMNGRMETAISVCCLLGLTNCCITLSSSIIPLTSSYQTLISMFQLHSWLMIKHSVTRNKFGMLLALLCLRSSVVRWS